MAKKFTHDIVHRWKGNPLLKIYYGASDTSICLATANVNELMQFCTIGEH